MPEQYAIEYAKNAVADVALLRAFDQRHVLNAIGHSPLSEVPIPLRSTDTPVKLNLQALLNRTYENGRYGRTLDYRRPLDPSLDAEDSARAEALLKAQLERQ